jgi:hypothetical protein
MIRVLVALDAGELRGTGVLQRCLARHRADAVDQSS